VISQTVVMEFVGLSVRKSVKIVLKTVESVMILRCAIACVGTENVMVVAEKSAEVVLMIVDFVTCV